MPIRTATGTAGLERALPAGDAGFKRAVPAANTGLRRTVPASVVDTIGITYR